MAKLEEKEKDLLSEKILLLGQKTVLEYDLNDTITDIVALEEAYITELRISLEAASSSKCF